MCFSLCLLGFYFDANILSCDSFLGITFFVASVTLLVYAVLGYWYILHSFVVQVAREFRSSKFVDILEKLIRIREDEEVNFNVSLLYCYCCSTINNIAIHLFLGAFCKNDSHVYGH
jgi:hypothetical protein